MQPDAGTCSRLVLSNAAAVSFLMASSTVLLWSDGAAKVAFQKCRYWPSFIGSRNEFDFNEKGKLPVLMWTEQGRFLEDNFNLKVVNGRVLDSNGDDVSEAMAAEQAEAAMSSSGASKKRKFVDVEGESSSAPVDSNNNESINHKRKRIKLTDYISDVFSAVRSTVAKTLTWIFQKLPFSGSALGSYEESKYESSERQLKVSDMKYLIFSDLNRRKYFVGPGDVYGGDYNIYKGGDPSNAHSLGTIRLIGKRNVMSARDLLSFTRVNNQVAKSTIIAYVAREAAGPRAVYLVFNFLGVSER